MSKKILNNICRYALAEGLFNLQIESLDNKTQTRLSAPGKASQNIILQETAMSDLINIFQSLSDISKGDLFYNKRFKMNLGKDHVSGTVSLSPGKEGENLIIKLNTEKARPFRLGALGLDRYQQKEVKRLIGRKQGLIILSSSPGDGVSSSYYSLLKLASENRSAYSLEDFPAFSSNNFNTISLKPADKASIIIQHLMQLDSEVIGLDLKSLSQEDWRAIFRARESGRLIILSQAKKNAAGVVKNLKELGFNSPEIANSVSLILSQKLFPRPCPKCLKKTNLSDTLKEIISSAWPIAAQHFPDFHFYNKSCPSCSKVRMKTAIFENMSFLKNTQIKGDYKPLILSALEKLGLGLIDVSDIISWSKEK